MKDIAIFGAGDFGREVVCLINEINESKKNDAECWNFIGFFDERRPAGYHNEYGEVLGNTEDLNHYDKELAVVIAFGDPSTIKKNYEQITNPKVYYPNLISPSIILYDKEYLLLGKGNIICGYNVLGCNVTIGNFNVLNVFTQLAHDTTLGDYNVIMPSVNISGGVHIGQENFFGVKSTILQLVRIGNHVRVGSNSVVIRNTKDGSLYMGNPARLIKI